MIRLDRAGVKTPKDWKRRVDDALAPNAAAFRKKARAFQKLSEQSAKRKKGFAAYAPTTLPKNAKGKREFPAVWQKHQEVRESIATMSFGHCAYCQSSVSSNHAGKGEKEKPPGQIEHFKPKSRFPSQAYVVGNYFLACASCNVAKSDKWPSCGYVRPDRGSPEKRFVFHEDGTISAARRRDAQATSTITDLGLDRYWLNEHRKNAIENHLKVVRTHLDFAKKYVQLSSVKLDDLVVSKDARFSEAINQNVRRAFAQALASP